MSKLSSYGRERRVCTQITMQRNLLYSVKDPFGYKHYWMLKLSDFLYNTYMKINEKKIKKQTPVYHPGIKKLLELANNNV